eukprot:CAMPEP_0204919364 /NCGR_PEP_ID=MMETSP1397-20131031/16782_1 /ASSEMBLY_ACC=CAM_ASM_000891 /TAXON_ID=49980 /ORGANISM="Climacostomum Climacostomum virens, Strain Stock W-24" /LENGTH=348 /DNA_ID=CAMNT_0052092955 /DNA_START=83 /DNA_END=1129 /DNA_ORIENTATION=-
MVLFPQYSGVVLQTKPRIETTIGPGTIPSNIEVVSKNLNAKFQFKTNTLRLDKRNNPYVEFALKTSLQAAEALKPASHSELTVRDFTAHLDIVGHPSFYLGGKTGLGSSSAVISSIVGSVLNHFGVTDIAVTHLVSQVAHSLAQNKIGSGFDIACCVLGSQIYKRFDRNLFSQVLRSEGLDPESLGKLLTHRNWSEFTPYSLPAKYSVNLHKTGSGSDTKKFTTTFLSWINANPKDGNLIFEDMKQVHEKILKGLEGDDIPELKKLFKENLKLLSKLGKLSGADIVPETVKESVLTILSQDTPVLAGVPGAGGFDAIYTITKKDSHISTIEKLSQSMPDLTLMEEDVV